MERCTMGDIAKWQPPEGDEVTYRNLVKCLNKIYSADWHSWVINVTTYETLFGAIITSEIESRLRFAVPTVMLAQIFDEDPPSLSERRYRALKRKLLEWPLGRALIYSPVSIMAKTHPAEACSGFLNLIASLKSQLISRHDASKELKTNASKKDFLPSPSPSSTSVLSRKRSHSPDPEPATTKRAKSPEGNVLDYMAQQTKILEKLLEMSRETQESMAVMKDKMATCSSVSFVSTTSRDEEEEDAETWVAPSIIDNSDHIAEAEPQFLNFAPETKEVEGKVGKADDMLAKQGIQCQRLDSESWQQIRYGDVQKNFQASPVFTNLKVNSNLATVTPSWQLVSVLEKADLCLGAISHGLLMQRKHFQDIYQDAPAEVKAYISKNFLAQDTNFRKTSDALLQYTCGKRSEIIQQRRALYKPPNKILNDLLHSIPPSPTHLFAEPQLSDLFKEQGGTSKFFPGQFRKPQQFQTGFRAPDKNNPKRAHPSSTFRRQASKAGDKSARRSTDKRAPAKQKKRQYSSRKY